MLKKNNDVLSDITWSNNYTYGVFFFKFVGAFVFRFLSNLNLLLCVTQSTMGRLLCF